MPGNGLGPPEWERPGDHHDAGPIQQLAEANTTARNSTATGRQQPYDVLAGNGRRYGAARRMEPLGTCGCVRDPDVDRHRHHGEISDKMTEAAVAAVELLDGLGTPGILNTATCQAVWRAGNRDLALAVHRRTTGGA